MIAINYKAKAVKVINHGLAFRQVEYVAREIRDFIGDDPGALYEYQRGRYVVQLTYKDGQEVSYTDKSTWGLSGTHGEDGWIERIKSSVRATVGWEWFD